MYECGQQAVCMHVRIYLKAHTNIELVYAVVVVVLEPANKLFHQLTSCMDLKLMHF